MIRELVRWEAPPPPARGSRLRIAAIEERGGLWRAVSDKLRERSGEWAVVAESRTSRGAAALASSIRFGVLADFRPAGDFDACSRRVNGVRTVYACYLPDGER